MLKRLLPFGILVVLLLVFLQGSDARGDVFQNFAGAAMASGLLSVLAAYLISRWKVFSPGGLILRTVLVALLFFGVVGVITIGGGIFTSSGATQGEMDAIFSSTSTIMGLGSLVAAVGFMTYFNFRAKPAAKETQPSEEAPQ
jgi:hypothetical protein